MTRPCDTDVAARTTPWGESYDDLAAAILADKSAAPVLAIAAFLYQRGEQSRLRSLIAEAVALNEREAVTRLRNTDVAPRSTLYGPR